MTIIDTFPALWFKGGPAFTLAAGERVLNSPADRNVIKEQYRGLYRYLGHDFIAVALRQAVTDGRDSLDVVKVENDISPSRWSHLNTGMQRMAIANVLRGRLARGESITILGAVYQKADRSENAQEVSRGKENGV